LTWASTAAHSKSCARRLPCRTDPTGWVSEGGRRVRHRGRFSLTATTWPKPGWPTAEPGRVPDGADVVAHEMVGRFESETAARRRGGRGRAEIADSPTPAPANGSHHSMTVRPAKRAGVVSIRWIIGDDSMR